MTAKKRGRPKTGKAMTDSERHKQFRARLKAAGGKELRLVLDRDAVDALLVCIGAHSGLTPGALVGDLLRREARYLQGVESELPVKKTGK